MRHAATLLALLVAALPVSAQALEGGIVKDEPLNFEISTPPDSIDWELVEVTEAEQKGGIQVHFVSKFTYLEDGSRSDVYVMVIPLGDLDARQSLDKVAARWQQSFEGFLDNPHDRKEGATTLGGEEAREVTLDGHTGNPPGPYRRTWILTRMGQYSYVLILDRSRKAIDDEDLVEELREIRDSFKFLRKEELKKNKEAKKAEGPGDVGPGEASKLNEPDIDPELLKPEEVVEDFWHFRCKKPEGFLLVKPTQEDLQRGVRSKFQMEKEDGWILVEILVHTRATARYTLEQLAETYEKHFVQRCKQTNPSKVDANYRKEFPLAKKAIKLEMVGRTTGVIKQTWLLAECENDRQYQIRIDTMRGAERKYQDKIDEFVESLKVEKK